MRQALSSRSRHLLLWSAPEKCARLLQARSAGAARRARPIAVRCRTLDRREMPGPPVFSSSAPFFLFDPAGGFFSSRPQSAHAGARRACQDRPLGAAEGLVLIRPSTTAEWTRSGRPLGWHRRHMDRSAEYTVLCAVGCPPHHGLRRVRRRNDPSALARAREESRGRRGPSRQGRRALPAGSVGISSAPQRAAMGAAVQRNGSPVVHMRCKITASFRATATVAFFLPMRFTSPRPQDLRSLARAVRARHTLAAS